MAVDADVVASLRAKFEAIDHPDDRLVADDPNRTT